MKSVRIADELHDAAEIEGKVMHRSIAGQLEYWIELGRRFEANSTVNEVRALLETIDV